MKELIGREVIILDDDPGNTGIIVDIIEELYGEHGFKVVVCATSDEVEELLSEVSLGAVLDNDVEGEIGGGLRAAKLIGEKFPKVKRIIMTGKPIKKDEEAELTRNSEAFFRKPVFPTAIINKLIELMEGL